MPNFRIYIISSLIEEIYSTRVVISVWAISLIIIIIWLKFASSLHQPRMLLSRGKCALVVRSLEEIGCGAMRIGCGATNTQMKTRFNCLKVIEGEQVPSCNCRIIISKKESMFFLR